MRCDHCKKDKALKTYAEVKEGKRFQLSLCEDCLALYLSRAPEFSVGPPKSPDSPWSSHASQRPLDEKAEKASAPPRKKRYPGRPEKCDACGTLWHQADTGSPGCPECFTLFARELKAAYKRLLPQLSSLSYEGSVPDGEDVFKQLRQALREKRKQLRTVLTLEKYEEAAELRDEISYLEKQLTAMPSEIES